MDTALGINISNNKNYKVVIADDSYADRQLLKRFLQGAQFNVLADVVSGEAVMDFMKYTDEIPDILFLDYQMEPGNAIDIIKELRPKHPNIMIVVVTGNMDKAVIGELIKLKINSYILKPIKKNTLDEKLIQILGRKDLVIQSKVASKKTPVKVEELSIPPLPGVAHKVLLFEANSVSGSLELEQIIMPDKAICADILRIANSALYARSKKITTIKDAITLLGLKTVKNIVVLQSKKAVSKNLPTSPLFKTHLLEFPILTSLIAFDLSVPLGLKSLREELFLYAMMRKVGMTILAIKSPQVYTEILNQCMSAPSDLAKFEKEEFELTHLDVGLFIFKTWQMPESFQKTMINQLFTIEEIDKVDNIDRILRLADIIGRKLLKVPILDSEIALSQMIVKYYKAREETVEVFDEDYYDAIKSHPFFEAI